MSTLSPGEQCVLSPPQSQLFSFLGTQWERHLRCAICLLWGADLWLRPSWWMSTIQDPRKTWLATGSLLAVWKRMWSLGPRLPLAFWLWLLPPCLSASGGGWAGPQPASSPLVFAQSFVLCVAHQCLRLELLAGKFFLSFFLSFFFFPLSLAIPQFGLLSHVSALRLSSGHSGPVLTLSNAALASLFSPCLLIADTNIWAASPLGVAVRHKIYGFYLFIFFPPGYVAL